MRVAILGALPRELAPLTVHITDAIQFDRHYWKGTIGTLAGHAVLALATGMGKVSAAAATQLALERFYPQAVIMIGVAGAIDLRLRPGDVVVAKEILQHDVNRPGSEEALGGELQHISRIVYHSHPELCRVAELAAIKLDWGLDFAGDLSYRLIGGRILTGDKIIYKQQEAERLRERLAGLCVEMEGASVAQVCAQNGDVPVLILRGISDSANEQAVSDVVTYFSVAAERLAELSLELLAQLHSVKTKMRKGF